MKNPNRPELLQFAVGHSSNIDFKHFKKTYRRSTAKPYSFLVNDTTLPSNNPSDFRQNLEPI